jgi:hypothetical protein
MCLPIRYQATHVPSRYRYIATVLHVTVYVYACIHTYIHTYIHTSKETTFCESLFIFICQRPETDLFHSHTIFSYCMCENVKQYHKILIAVISSTFSLGHIQTFILFYFILFYFLIFCATSELSNAVRFNTNFFCCQIMYFQRNCYLGAVNDIWSFLDGKEGPSGKLFVTKHYYECYTESNVRWSVNRRSNEKKYYTQKILTYLSYFSM